MDDLARPHDFEPVTNGAAPAKTLPQVAGEKERAAAAARTSWLNHLPAILAAGLICGLLTAMFAISAAALLFSSILSDHITLAIGICLTGTIILTAIIALFSSCPGMLSVTQEVTVVTLAVIATSIHSAMHVTHSEPQILATIVVMIGLATAATGLALLAMGAFRLGRLIRFIPYPVIGGFLAGMGWLIASGAIAVMLGVPVTGQTIGTLFEIQNVVKWLPAAAFAILVDALSRRSGSPLVLPVTIAAVLLLFHSGIWMLDLSTDELQRQGWLFAPPLNGGILLPFQGNPLAQADWAVIWSETPKMIALLAISAAALLFASSGIELSVKRDIDLDRELRAAGIANVFAGAGGGAAGFQGLGLTMLAHHLGAAYRITGVLVAAVCTVILFFGATLLSYIPIPLFGGLLLWIGGALLCEWLIGIYARVARREYLIVLLIVSLIVTVGLLEGVMVGVFAAAALFTVEYARVDVVKYAVTGEDFHSRVEHAPRESEYLKTQGQHTLVLRLQGFIFFGSVHRLQQLILDRVGDGEAPPIRFLVLDCRDVTGFDSSAVQSLTKTCGMIRQNDGQLIISALRPAISERLYRILAGCRDAPPFLYFEQVDKAVAWCEDRTLNEWRGAEPDGQTHFCTEELNRQLDYPEAFQALLPYLEKIELAPQSQLIRQGDNSHDLYLVESGVVNVLLESPDAPEIHLRTLGPGTIVGEMSFFLKRPRTASAIAETKAVVWQLREESFLRMAKLEPQLAYALNGHLLRIIAERLDQSNRLVRSLTG